MTSAEYFMLGIFITLGGFSLIASICNFEWYFRTSGAMMFVKWLGRPGARLFYALLGIALIGCGIAGFIYG